MVNQGIERMNRQLIEPEFEEQKPNHLASSVHHCAFFFLFSGASIMMWAIGAPLINCEHIFVGVLLFILGLVLELLHVFLLHGSPTAMMVGALLVRVIRRMFHD